MPLSESRHRCIMHDDELRTPIAETKSADAIFKLLRPETRPTTPFQPAIYVLTGGKS